MAHGPRPVCDVLARLAAGEDQAAWSHLVALLGDEVVRVCRRIAGPGACAEDAAQEVWMRVRQEAGRFTPVGEDPEPGARAWVRRIAATTALQALRSERRSKERERQAEPPAGEPDPQAVVVQRDLAELVRRFLSGLPERERIAVTLRHLGELEPDTIAREMGCPVGTVRSLVSRGLERLRGRLQAGGIAISLLALSAFLERIDAAEAVDATLPAAGASRCVGHGAALKLAAVGGLLGAAGLVIALWLPPGEVSDPPPSPVAEQPAPPVPPPQPAVLDTASARVAWHRPGFTAPFSAITPALAGDLILVAGADRVAAFAMDGQPRWEIAVEAYHHAPAVAGERVVIADLQRLLAADRRTGTVLWSKDLPDASQNLNQSSPLVVGDLVILPSRKGWVKATQIADGAERWQWVGTGNFDSACLVGDRLVVLDWQRGLQAHALDDGRRLWRRDLPGAGSHAAAASDGTILVPFHDDRRNRGGVCLLSVIDGHEVWRFEQDGLDCLGVPAVSGGTVVTSSKEAVVALAQADGREIWRQPRRQFGYERIAVDTAGRIMLGGDDGILRWLAADDGRELGALGLTGLLPAAPDEHPRSASFVLDNGVWRRSSAHSPHPLAVSGRLYATTGDGMVLAIDLPGVLPEAAGPEQPPLPPPAVQPIPHPSETTF